MSLQGKKSRELHQRSQKVTPLGVHSNFRYWGDDDTLVITRGNGAYVWDADGRRYIDYRLAFGPVILGHADPRVNAAVTEAIKGGTLFAMTHPLEIEVAERIVRMTGVEKVRLANSGTEATMHALRIARAYTGREKVLKFEGDYHGFYDYMLFSTASTSLENFGPRENPANFENSKGIPAAIKDLVVNLPYNDLEMLEERLEDIGDQLAAVIVEPTMGNMAGILPRPGWLEKIRELCDRYGIIMIMDEVKTGFRLARGGAQEYFNVRGDLVTYAKSLGNGYPVAAIGGKSKIMDIIAPGSVAHGGTYTGNVPGTAAARATLEIMEKEPIHARLTEIGTRLMKGIDEVLIRRGIAHSLTGHPAMFGFSLGSSKPPLDARDYAGSDESLYEKMMHHLIADGVFPEADGREPWFICTALSEADIAETLEKFDAAAKSVL